MTNVNYACRWTTNYWANDQSGDPLFVTTVQTNAGMVKMLPEILKQVREVVGDGKSAVRKGDTHGQRGEEAEP